MTDKKIVKIFEHNNIETNLEEFNTPENLISDILKEENFNKLNNLQNNKNIRTNSCINKQIHIGAFENNIEFISLEKNSIAPFHAVINEKEFFKIVGLTQKGLSKRSGKYQESLYEYYLEAKKENDPGFISDILNKAAAFNNNLNYVKKLSRNKKFMKKWQKNFGKESPVIVFKNSGKLKKINTIYNSL